MRAGEVVRAYVLGRQTSIGNSAVLATIVVERVIDGAIMILLLFLSFIIFPAPNCLLLAAVTSGLVFRYCNCPDACSEKAKAPDRYIRRRAFWVAQ